MSDRSVERPAAGGSQPVDTKLLFRDYPKHVTLRDGREVVLRPMTKEDLDRSCAFFKGLPDDIRLYLRADVTKRDVVERRMKHDDRHEFYRLVAVDGDRIAGDATIYREAHSWKRHLGELRVIIHPEYQANGMGMHLIRELYEIANMANLTVLYSNIIEVQKGAVKILEKLGFKKEVVKKSHVRDLNGRKHDLIVMTCNLGELWDRLEMALLDMDSAPTQE
ncbi:MAG: GNAT family N-acetyltransferase [Acidobacteriota bacterium]